jgi:hypothetical protein
MTRPPDPNGVADAGQELAVADLQRPCQTLPNWRLGPADYLPIVFWMDCQSKGEWCS